MVKLLVWPKWIWWSSQGDNHSFTSKTKFKIHHWGILYEKWEQGKGKKKKKKNCDPHRMVGSCVKRVDRELLGTEVRVPETTDLHRNATGDVLFMCDKSYREKHRLREKNEMLCAHVCQRSAFQTNGAHYWKNRSLCSGIDLYCLLFHFNLWTLSTQDLWTISSVRSRNVNEA